MKNQYLKNLHKIEFAVTYACTGRCRHCSEGDHGDRGERIDPCLAAEAVRRIAAEYEIQTVMTFGGEPLLYPDAVEEIMYTAKDLCIPKRQVITNGYFSKNAERIHAMAEKLAESGVNDLLLSVDAFHQEYVPLDTVTVFAKEVKRCGIPMRLQPAWLVSRAHDNPYNRKTRDILDSFHALSIPVGEGNLVFPEGNAQKHLAEYFEDECPKNPYREDPYDLLTVSVSPNGDLLDGNIYRQDVMEIVKNYNPHSVKR